MNSFHRALGITVLLLAMTSSLRAEPVATVEAAARVVHDLAAIPLKGIPASLLQDAAGVAVIPHVVKVGLVIDERFGRGVVLAREPNGRWSNPVFVTLTGNGIGVQAGVQATDLVLVFKTRTSLDRALRGKLTLGTDVAVAAGPVGREAERATDRHRLRAEILTYSRSRGLFAGISVEGSRLHTDATANDLFYNQRGCRPEDVISRRVAGPAAAEALKIELLRLAGDTPVVVVPASFTPLPGSGPR